MKLTSTAHLVGGDVVLPAGGVPLADWELQLVADRTTEPVGRGQRPHRPDRVPRRGHRRAARTSPCRSGSRGARCWRTDNLGELFLDYNNWGQRFDGLIFNPHEFLLSDVRPGRRRTPYLGDRRARSASRSSACTSVNIKDATAAPASPYLGREVTVPEGGHRAQAGPTRSSRSSGTWHDVVSQRPGGRSNAWSVQVDYNVASQDGFLGTGSAEFGFLHSDGLDDHGRDPQRRDRHPHQLGRHARPRRRPVRAARAASARSPAARGSRARAHPDLALRDPRAERAAGAIFGPKAGYAVEIDMTVTPTTFDFYASGDMLMSVGGVDVEASAMVHLLVDWSMASRRGRADRSHRRDAVVAGPGGRGPADLARRPGHAVPAGTRAGRRSAAGSAARSRAGSSSATTCRKASPGCSQPTNPHFGMSTRASSRRPSPACSATARSSFAINVLHPRRRRRHLRRRRARSRTGAAGRARARSRRRVLPYVVGACGIYIHGEILGGLVSASAWANLACAGRSRLLRGDLRPRGLRGVGALRVVQLNAGLDAAGFYLR